MNTFGNLLRLTTFGESHGPVIGGVLDGMPAGITIDMDFVKTEMGRRRPGQSDLASTRDEKDDVEFLSGLFEGKTTGTPIGFIIRNTDAHPNDYSCLDSLYRPSHADYTYDAKYGIRDYRGGGRASARETAVRVVAGALAKQFLLQRDIHVKAALTQVGNETDPERMKALIHEIIEAGDSIGGIVRCTIDGCPVGLGEPIYGKLHAALGNAMLSINACHGFDYGSGFEGVAMRGSQQNDIFICRNGKISTTTNHSGGIQGGISNGQPIYMRVLFKPTASILQPQRTIDRDGNNVTLNLQGRHDPCVAIRAVPVVEAMAALVIADYLLIARI